MLLKPYIKRKLRDSFQLVLLNWSNALPGDILGNLRVRISDPWGKLPLENVFEILYRLEKPKITIPDEEVRLQVPLSSSQCALLLPKNAILFSRSALLFSRKAFSFSNSLVCPKITLKPLP